MGSAPMSNSIGTTIRELRKQRGLSVPKLAALLSLSQSYLYDLEHDRRVPSVPILQRLAEFFHVTADELMTTSTPENKNAPAETKPGEGAKTRRIISMEDWIKVPIVSRECTACCGEGITAADITNWDEGFILINQRMKPALKVETASSVPSTIFTSRKMRMTGSSRQK